MKITQTYVGDNFQSDDERHIVTVDHAIEATATAATGAEALRKAFELVDADLAKLAEARSRLFAEGPAARDVSMLVAELARVARALHASGVGIRVEIEDCDAALPALVAAGGEMTTDSQPKYGYETDRASISLKRSEWDRSEILANGRSRNIPKINPDVAVVFRLTMSGVNSWNGRWSGEDKNYTLTRYLSAETAAKVAGRSWTHAFGDGWVAKVEATALAEGDYVKSDGFCGYDWMVANIIRHDSTNAPIEVEPPPSPNETADAVSDLAERAESPL